MAQRPTSTKRTDASSASGAWDLLIHEIPARPPYLRIKVHKRLLRLGAMALKDSVYLVPARARLRSPLQEIAEEVRQGGGAAHLLEARFVHEDDGAVCIEAFRARRDADYQALAHQADSLISRGERRSATRPAALRAHVGRAKRRLAAIERIDFFAAPARAEAAARISALDRFLAPEADGSPPSRRGLVGRTWVTRRGIQVDRIACAWFIRRFLDPGARFRFIDPARPDARPGESTFDMAGADFTHEDDRCSLETLILRTGTRDPALARVAEIVHEIDIEDGKYSSAETKGVRQMLAGMLLANGRDEDRLDRGFAMLDDLYRSFRPRRAGSGRSAREPDRRGRRRRP